MPNSVDLTQHRATLFSPLQNYAAKVVKHPVLPHMVDSFESGIEWIRFGGSNAQDRMYFLLSQMSKKERKKQDKKPEKQKFLDNIKMIESFMMWMREQFHKRNQQATSG